MSRKNHRLTRKAPESYEIRWSMVSTDVPDWSREKPAHYWEPGKRLLRTIRSYGYWQGKHNAAAPLMRKLAVLRHRCWSVIAAAEIPLNCTIDGGPALTHPNGIVIHPDAVIGVNRLILQQVTIGVGGKKDGAPAFGSDVDIGAGAKILGGVHIGDSVRIGANAIVIDDIPARSTAVGVPARVVRVREK